MPVFGGAGVSAASPFPSSPIIKEGVYVPAGWGAAWRAARDNSASELVECAWFGDSTSSGSTGAGALYSPTQRVRARAIAAGVTDGGKGLIANLEDQIDYTEPAGEVNGLILSEWTSSFPLSALIGGATPVGQAAGARLQYQGKGTMVRIHYVRHGSSGDFTYSIDDGTPVLVTSNAPGGSSFRPVETITVTGLTEGLHTVKLVNLGGKNSTTTLDTSTPYACANVSIQRGAGFVLHKVARSGARTVDWFDPLAENGGWSSVLWRPLTAMGLNAAATTTPSSAFDSANGYGLQLSEGAHPAAVRCRLAVLHLGFNDLSNAVDAATQASVTNRVATSVAAFTKLAKSAGASPVVLSGQYPGNSQYRLYGGQFTSAVRGAAIANGAAWVDVVTPLGNQWGTNPHLSITQYRAQGDFLWDEVLSK